MLERTLLKLLITVLATLCAAMPLTTTANVRITWVELSQLGAPVVTGRLTQVKIGCAFKPDRNDILYSIRLDCGVLEIDSVLQGDPDLERIPVNWFAEWVPIGDVQVPVKRDNRHPIFRRYPDGLEGIWVILYPGPNDDDDLIGIEYLPMDSLASAKMVLEVRKARSNTRMQPTTGDGREK